MKFIMYPVMRAGVIGFRCVGINIYDADEKLFYDSVPFVHPKMPEDFVVREFSFARNTGVTNLDSPQVCDFTSPNKTSVYVVSGMSLSGTSINVYKLFSRVNVSYPSTLKSYDKAFNYLYRNVDIRKKNVPA